MIIPRPRLFVFQIFFGVISRFFGERKIFSEVGYFEVREPVLRQAGELAFAALFEVGPRYREAVVGRGEGSEAFRLASAPGDEHADAAARAAADASAQLMQLLDAVALWGFYHDDRGLGHVDSDFEDRRSDEQL